MYKGYKIILYQVKGNNYINFQSLNDHKNWVSKIIEINNKYIVSCSSDQSIIFYYKYYKYRILHRLSTNGICHSMTKIKENEICYLETIILL